MGLLYQILIHRSTKSILDEDTDNVLQDIELRVYPEPFFTSYQISTVNTNLRSKTQLKPKTLFKWVFMGTNPALSPRILTKDTTFSN